ncbi:unnamed protein product [Brassicogethes aeneus]|uniref:Protein Wnt n=1 Tax=Brassicogethes aeneus TaxID=1431903 RepID=A0A9P0AZB0_BRAAE|nr:unnamed protein product [Brassicogethes aeneus]
MEDEMMQNDQGAASCSALPGLSPGQGRLCHIYMDHMNSVAVGAKQALTECKQQFQNRRWNCSLLDDVNVFGPVITFAWSNIESQHWPEVVWHYISDIVNSHWPEVVLHYILGKLREELKEKKIAT